MYIILTQCFPSRVGGIESLVSNLALSIGKKNKVIVLADQHHITKDKIYDNQNQDKILVQRFGGLKFFRRRKKIKKLMSLVQSQKINCVIADTWKSIEFCVNDLRANNIPVICLAHGNELLFNNNNKKKRISKTLAQVSTVVVNSNFTIGLVEKLIGNRNKIKVVYPGSKDLRTIESDNTFKIKGEPVLLTLSRLEKRKGHIIVLQALQKLKKYFPSIKYIIAGEGKEKLRLKKIVKEYDLHDHVIFTGNVNEKQKKNLFDYTTLMVMPTLDESLKRSIEGFGIVYLEAAFFGIPSIASNVGGTPEAVLNDKTGIIIHHHSELFTILKNLLLNKNKLEFLGKNAQNRAESSFTWDKVVNNYFLSFK
tara:strand:- start:2730 stop:3827 length:1098 start_codon:yes stop_codon:yes gene_type:complete